MHQSYHMVVINILAICAVISFILFYRYIFPKKNVSYFFLLVLISILPIISIFRSGPYESGDFSLHIYRTVSFYGSLMDQQWMPSWADMLNAKYGYPLFIFINPLPYYLISFFHFIGFSFINSMKIFLAFSFVISGIGMYFWAKLLFKNQIVAFTAAVFYLFAPYHLIDLHFRVDIGEVLTFATTPFLFLAIHALIDKPSIKRSLFAGLAGAAVITSHQAMAVFAIGLTIPYIFLLFVKKKKDKWQRLVFILLSYIIMFLIAGYTLLPYLTQTKLINMSTIKSFLSFTPPAGLFYAPWRYGLLFQGPHGELIGLIGYTQLLVVIVSLFLIRKHNKYSLDLKYWLIIFFCLFLLLFQISEIFWHALPLIHLIAIPNRLLLFMNIAISILAALLCFYTKKRYLIYLLLIVTIGYTILNWGNRNTIPAINDQELELGVPLSTNAGEGWSIGVPIWRKHPAYTFESRIPSQSIQIIKGTGKIKTVSRSTIQHTYIASASTPLVLQENTWYYPNWTLFIDNKQSQIDYRNKQNPGLIIFTIPKGLHQIAIVYKDIFIEKLFKYISTLTLFISILLLISLSTNQFTRFLSHLQFEKYRFW